MIIRSWVVPLGLICVGSIVSMVLLEKATNLPFVDGGQAPRVNGTHLADLSSPFLRTRESAALFSHHFGTGLALACFVATIALLVVPCHSWSSNPSRIGSFVYIVIALISLLDVAAILGFDAWSVTASLIHTSDAQAKLPIQFIVVTSLGCLSLLATSFGAWKWYGRSFGADAAAAIEDRKDLQSARDDAHRDLYKSIKQRWRKGKRRTSVASEHDEASDDDDQTDARSTVVRKSTRRSAASRPPSAAPSLARSESQSRPGSRVRRPSHTPSRKDSTRSRMSRKDSLPEYEAIVPKRSQTMDAPAPTRRQLPPRAYSLDSAPVYRPGSDIELRPRHRSGLASH